MFALGCVLYEMVCGHRAFPGDTAADAMSAVLTQDPAPLKVADTKLPRGLQRVISKTLEKKRDRRYQAAEDLLSDLKELKRDVDPTEAGGDRRPTNVITAVAAISMLLLILLGLQLWRQLRMNERRRWAETDALPRIEDLAEKGRFEQAHQLALEVDSQFPDLPILDSVWDTVARTYNIDSEPSGARVWRRPYDTLEASWQELGTTPIEGIRIPIGYSSFRFEKDGRQPVEITTRPGRLTSVMNPVRLPAADRSQPGMTFIPGGLVALDIPGLEHLEAIELGDYLLDTHEVTNARYAEFLRAGGYRDPTYWQHPILIEGHEYEWSDAMALFTDRSGEPGPASWSVGRYPGGEGEHPVNGISWYEAAAFAEFAGRELPTIYHWNRAAETWSTEIVVPSSNYDGKGPVPVGSYSGVTAFGVADMAGNVREWCSNRAGETHRAILGGSWSDTAYSFNDLDAADPGDRSLVSGFRTMLRLAPEQDDASLAETIETVSRDFLAEEPVSDEVFRAYLSLFNYDRSSLRSEVEWRERAEDDFAVERVTYDAAYGSERLTAFLYLPIHYRPPHPTVVFFPGSEVIYLDSSERLKKGYFGHFPMSSGYAGLLPIYKSTFERGDELKSDYPDSSTFYRDHVVMWVKDLRRSIDFLHTRKDVDTDNIAFYGVSWGGALAPIMLAVEDRMKTGILHAGGLMFQRSLPEVEPLNYLPRVKQPVLTLNGKYDWWMPLETSLIPMFQLLGTSAANKRHVLFETGHFLPEHETARESLDWLRTHLRRPEPIR
jgi:dienelactone hydrolase